uniref:EF-hand domain-containing protein n=1 Tax=Globisporangium ultimum (strain ATCC 200006 / CBS 805.95 / DAOM BR144) TaxID=431595 RepID=K3WX69_GLOUD
MFTNARRSHILVMKADFADVWIDIAVNAAAQRHANGERVAVTKGGLRARSIVDVYDGTRIEVGYNTKVVAQVNGRVTTWKPSGVCVVAKDSGRVEYHRVSTTTSNSGGSGEDDDLDVTTHNGVYYFDCKQGRFMLCDQEQNQFFVDLSDCATVRTFRGIALCAPPKISVDLAGVVSDLEAEKYQVDPIPAKAVVNDPIEPHLLILHGDGTAKEILRPRDIEQFLEDSKRSASGNRKEMYSGSQAPNGSSSSPFKYRVFFEELSSSSSSPSSSEIRPLFQDPNLQSEMHRLMKPVNSAAKYLPNYPSMRVPCPQFTIVRRIEQFQPLSASELQEMHVSLHNWTQWQQAREVNKEQYSVVDPRDEDMIAQQLAVQKKVLAAYKATRSRKRLEKQKARELKRKLQMQAEHIDDGGVTDASGGGASHMETVQEGDEPHMDEGDDDSDGDEFDYLSGSDSANGGNLDLEVDDPDELLWTAFSQADAANCGKLSIAQARQALVHVLGVGVPTSELMAALMRFKLQDPPHVSFDTFSELVNFFRSSDEDNNDASVVHTKKGGGSAAHLPKLHGLSSAAFGGSEQQQQQEKEEALTPRKFPIAAGSATEAIRLKKTLE